MASFIRGMNLPIGGIATVEVTYHRHRTDEVTYHRHGIRDEKTLGEKVLFVAGRINRIVLTVFGYIPGLATLSGAYRIAQAIIISKFSSHKIEKESIKDGYKIYEPSDGEGEILRDELFRGILELVPVVGQLGNFYLDCNSVFSSIKALILHEKTA